MLICAKCGREAADEETFCGRCGAFLEWSAARAVEREAIPAANAPEPVRPGSRALHHAGGAPEPEGPAVVATPVTRTVAVEPGSRAAVAITVANRGRTVDQLTVQVMGVAEAWSAVEPPRLNLMPGTSGSTEVAFRPPRSAAVLAGTHEVEVAIRSSQHPEASVVERLAVEVGPYVELEASLRPAVLHGHGATATLLHVANRGNTPLDLAPAADDPEAALAFAFTPHALHLEAGAATDVLVVVKPRTPLATGPERSRSFRAVVTTGAGARQEIAGTFVQTPVPAPPSPPVAAPSGPPLVTAMSANAVQAAPGGQATITVDVHNRSPVADRVVLEARGPAAAWATIEPARLAVGPDGWATATLTVRPPRVPPPPPTRQPLEIAVRSAVHPDVVVADRVAVDILPLAAPEVTLAPSVLRGAREATAKVHVANRGNAATEVVLRGDDPELAFELRFSPAKLRVGPGATAHGTVTVRARRENRTRAELARPFRVVAAAPDGSSAGSDGTFVQEPRRGGRTWPRALALIAVLGFGALVVANLDGNGLDLDGIGPPGATGAAPPTEAPRVEIVTPEPLAVDCGGMAPSDWLNLDAGRPMVEAERFLCVLEANLVAAGPGSGPVRVVAGATEILWFDMAEYEGVGSPGGGSGERYVTIPAVAVEPGTAIRLDLGGCAGEGCATLLVQLGVAAP